MMGNLEVPVYLFTGFLGSGKTTFLMDLLSGEDFYDGERTMVLLCEEGEVELDPEQFAFPDIFVERIQKEDLQPAKLADLTEKPWIPKGTASDHDSVHVRFFHSPDRIFISKDMSVSVYRYRNTVLYFFNHIPVCGTTVLLFTRPSVHCELAYT